MNPHTNASPIGFSYASDGRASTVLWGHMVPAALRRAVGRCILPLPTPTSYGS
jgi:hypothetical protein